MPQWWMTRSRRWGTIITQYGTGAGLLNAWDGTTRKVRANVGAAMTIGPIMVDYTTDQSSGHGTNVNDLCGMLSVYLINLNGTACN